MNQFKCKICLKKFTRKHSLKIHSETHEKKRKKIPCLRCGGGFSTPYNLKKHQEKCKAEKNLTPKDIEKAKQTEKIEKEYLCEICGRSYDRRYDVKMHILVVHVGVRKFNCANCSSKFSRKPDFLRHTRKYHSNTGGMC